MTPAPLLVQVKIQPPELKGMMDKKLSGACRRWGRRRPWAAARRRLPQYGAGGLAACCCDRPSAHSTAASPLLKLAACSPARLPPCPGCSEA